ncbi:MAG: NTP transferase domain-containing protein [Alphaproteobacteria bacterium]|nr:NTP transferase domain-containing protein [Alphaproteobacteria bacterium]
MDSPHILPVILSGGGGTRLWPLSSPERPKQFLALDGDATLLQQAVARVTGPGFAPPLLVANERHATLIEDQLRAVGCEGARLLLEPEPRNTAAAIALAAVAAPDGATPLLVIPSDHVIRDPAAFRAAVRTALPLAEKGWLCTFGIAPDRPETGYGWIRLGEALGDGARAAAAFVEKPPRDAAERMLTDRAHVWNSGIFLFRAAPLLAALERDAPAVLAAARAAVANAAGTGGRILPERTAFARAPSISFDHAVMEKADRVAVVPVDMGWSDVGSWDALYDIGTPDEDGNVAEGAVLALDTAGCLIRSVAGRRVTVIGLTDLIVVAGERDVLVLPRGQAQQVRAIADRLERS